jgi:hypothetical protein
MVNFGAMVIEWVAGQEITKGTGGEFWLTTPTKPPLQEDP